LLKETLTMQISSTLKDLSGSAASARTWLVLLLVAALLHAETVPAFAQTQQTPDPSTVENQVKKWGVGKSVKMTLLSGERVSGHIRAIAADSFTVKARKTERSILYAQVTEIKDPGPLTWILVGAAIVIVIILIAHH
jgi:hypothetical protein